MQTRNSLGRGRYSIEIDRNRAIARVRYDLPGTQGDATLIATRSRNSAARKRETRVSRRMLENGGANALRESIDR